MMMTMDIGESTDEMREKMQISSGVVRVPVKHTNLGIRSHAMDMSTMVELTSFSTLGKIQPFLITISTTAALVVDLHCHLSEKEVCGYLGGHWDINAHNLAITSAFPCRYVGKDRSAASQMEAEIARAMEQKQVTLVGWYHSHPRSHASPSLRDVDYQLDYQIKMKGLSDNGYTPCVGLICSPYNTDSNCYESNFNVFWSLPPPENRPHEYPRPMLLSYTLSQEHFLSQDALDEIRKIVEFYSNRGGVDFTAIFSGNTTYLERLKSSLASKLPRSQSNGSYWDVIRGMICPGVEEPLSDSSFTVVKFPLVSDSLSQSSGLTSSNPFLTPGMSSTSKAPFGAPSTSRDGCKNVVDSTGTDNSSVPIKEPTSVGSKHKLPSEFTSGELTVSVKSLKCDYDFPSADFTKVTNLLAGDSSACKARLTPDFPLADISQITKFSDLTKLTSFSTADLAKLSGFPIGEFAKAPPAYVCNIANLFAPLGKNAKDVSLAGNDASDRKGNDFGPVDGITFKASPLPTSESCKTGIEEFSAEPKKLMADSGDVSAKSRMDYAAEELSISSVKPDFGAMLDMTMHAKKQQTGEADSSSLSKDRQ